MALRLLLVLRFPVSTRATRPFTKNWPKTGWTTHVYGIVYANGLTPSDMRAPGYPAFLAIVYLLFRRGEGAIVLAQAFLDLGTCFLVAWLASRLAPQPHRPRVMLAALWLAATCPFVANYAAVPLTEVLATFLTAAALIPLVGACIASGRRRSEASDERSPWNSLVCRPACWWGWPRSCGRKARFCSRRWPWSLPCAGGAAPTGASSPAPGALTAAGLLLPLCPGQRATGCAFTRCSSWRRATPLRQTNTRPRGFYAWTATWLVRYRDVYLVPWNIGSDRVEIGDIPPAAFDSPDERARVAALLDQYNATLRMTAGVDRGFAALARERTARHPLRTYLFVPAGPRRNHLVHAAHGAASYFRPSLAHPGAMERGSARFQRDGVSGRAQLLLRGAGHRGFVASASISADAARAAACALP